MFVLTGQVGFAQKYHNMTFRSHIFPLLEEIISSLNKGHNYPDSTEWVVLNWQEFKTKEDFDHFRMTIEEYNERERRTSA